MEADKFIKSMEAHACAGESYDFSEPYELDENEIAESMSKDEKKAFYSKLQKDKVRFQYKKKDGSTRDAYGTLKPELLPPPRDSNDTRTTARERMKRAFPDDSVFYYDLDKKAFRSFKMFNFIKYL